MDDNRAMLILNPIVDTELALRHSPILRAVLLTIDHIEKNGPLTLTATRSFKRTFVEWAADAFEWPFYTRPELYAFNKVLNESDFLPLVILHELLLETKLARHRKGVLHLARLANQVKDDPAGLWVLLTRHLLCVTDHSRYTRYGDTVHGDWDVFLNVINVEAQHGVTEDRLCSLLFGRAEEQIRMVDYRLKTALYIHVLRPLCWMGLLEEIRSGEGFAREEHFFKTPLWHATLTLKTDANLEPATQH